MGQYKASYSRLKLLGALKRMFENHKNCSKMLPQSPQVHGVVGGSHGSMCLMQLS